MSPAGSHDCTLPSAVKSPVVVFCPHVDQGLVFAVGVTGHRLSCHAAHMSRQFEPVSFLCNNSAASGWRWDASVSRTIISYDGEKESHDRCIASGWRPDARKGVSSGSGRRWDDGRALMNRQ